MYLVASPSDAARTALTRDPVRRGESDRWTTTVLRRDVVRLVKLSKASYRKMQENIVWAAGYNVFAIPLAAGVLAPIGILLSPAAGALLMSLSTVIVAINAQLLRRVDLSIPELPGGTPSTEAQPAD